MAAISRRWRGGRIYNNTRTRELLRRKCVKPADLTTHSPPKICSRPSTATRPARAFSHSLPAHFRSPFPRRCTPADLTTHSPPKTSARSRTATRPRRALPPPTQRRRTPTQSRTAPAGCAKHSPQRHAASPSVPLRAQKKRHRTVHVRCRMSRSTVVAVGHLGW